MNNENELNASGQPGLNDPNEASQNYPQNTSVTGNNTVQSGGQENIPTGTAPLQNTELLSTTNSLQQSYVPQSESQVSSAAPIEQMTNQGNVGADRIAPEQPQQTTPPQGAPTAQPQYQYQSQSPQSIPTQTTGGQQGGQQYQSQTNASGGYQGQSGAPYGDKRSASPTGNYSRTKGFAIASLICGICSVVFCCLGFLSLLTGIAAIVFGILVLSDTEKNGSFYPDSKTMRGMAIAGLVCGIIGTIFGLFALIGLPSILGILHADPFDDFVPYMDF